MHVFGLWEETGVNLEKTHSGTGLKSRSFFLWDNKAMVSPCNALVCKWLKLEQGKQVIIFHLSKKIVCDSFFGKRINLWWWVDTHRPSSWKLTPTLKLWKPPHPFGLLQTAYNTFHAWHHEFKSWAELHKKIMIYEQCGLDFVIRPEHLLCYFVGHLSEHTCVVNRLGGAITSSIWRRKTIPSTLVIPTTLWVLQFLEMVGNTIDCHFTDCKIS